MWIAVPIVALLSALQWRSLQLGRAMTKEDKAREECQLRGEQW